MAVVGFSITKIVVEKFNAPSGKMTIKNNVDIKDIKTVAMALGTAKQQGLKIEYEYSTEYEEKIGKIMISGEVLFLANPEKTKETIDTWTKKRMMPDDIMRRVLSNIMERCTYQALFLAKETNLPSPIPLPKIAPGAKPEVIPKEETQEKLAQPSKETKPKKSKK